MIDVSPLTHMSQQQPIPVNPDPIIRAVAPVESAKGAETGGARDSESKAFADSLEANVIRDGNSSLQFRIDQDSRRLVVSLLDSNGDVLRQIPSELILRIAQRIEAIQARGKLGLDELA